MDIVTCKYIPIYFTLLFYFGSIFPNVKMNLTILQILLCDNNKMEVVDEKKIWGSDLTECREYSRQIYFELFVIERNVLELLDETIQFQNNIEVLRFRQIMENIASTIEEYRNRMVGIRFRLLEMFRNNNLVNFYGEEGNNIKNEIIFIFHQLQKLNAFMSKNKEDFDRLSYLYTV